jgi:hypothetical protein
LFSIQKIQEKKKKKLLINKIIAYMNSSLWNLKAQRARPAHIQTTLSKVNIGRQPIMGSTPQEEFHLQRNVNPPEVLPPRFSRAQPRRTRRRGQRKTKLITTFDRIRTKFLIVPKKGIMNKGRRTGDTQN